MDSVLQIPLWARWGRLKLALSFDSLVAPRHVEVAILNLPCLSKTQIASWTLPIAWTLKFNCLAESSHRIVPNHVTLPNDAELGLSLLMCYLSLNHKATKFYKFLELCLGITIHLPRQNSTTFLSSLAIDIGTPSQKLTPSPYHPVNLVLVQVRTKTISLTRLLSIQQLKLKSP